MDKLPRGLCTPAISRLRKRMYGINGYGYILKYNEEDVWRLISMIRSVTSKERILRAISKATGVNEDTNTG
jgi:hypothetical protein